MNSEYFIKNDEIGILNHFLLLIVGLMFYPENTLINIRNITVLTISGITVFIHNYGAVKPQKINIIFGFCCYQIFDENIPIQQF